jgi:FkbM family methyltransferase
MIKSFAKRLPVRIPPLQPLWEFLNALSLFGMNIGGGSNVKDSGERWVMRHFKRYLPEGRRAVVFDVGANIGDYAKEILETLGNGVDIYCFEPSRKTFGMLSANLAEHPNARLLNHGLGAKESAATLYYDAVGSGIASVYNRKLDHFGISFADSETVRLKTLDGFCAEEKIDRVNFLKLDVEGHELDVLKGGAGLLSSGSVDFIQFEFGGCNIDSRTYFQDFFYALNPRYRMYRVLGSGIAPVNVYKERHECFITTNYLAISRKIS